MKLWGRASVTLLALAIQFADLASAQAAPQKPEPDRSWLRQATHGVHEAAQQAPAGGVPYGGFLALLVVLGLGLAALRARKRRGATTRQAQPARVQVLGTSRIGPKAHATVIEVAGRVLLLGVTDHSVQRLLWLNEPDAKRSSRDEPFSYFDSEPPQATAPRALFQAAAPVDAANENGSRSFRDILGALLGRSPREAPSAAEQIAADTADVFESPELGGGVPAGIQVEGQAAGLAARFRKAEQ